MRAIHYVGAAVVAACGLAHCLDPTEIVVVLTTDVPCTQVNSTAIAVGPPGDDSRGVSAQTPSCSGDGGIGTLVVTPSRGSDDEVEIRVTLGVGATGADQCVAPNFTGCIVARRQLGYVPHRPLTLPIELQQVCLGNPCDPNSTCVSGQCFDAGIPTCDQAGTCAIDAGTTPACDVTPTFVRAATTPVTPHLVRTSTGYAIGYETAAPASTARSYHVFAVSTDGLAQPDVVLNKAPIGLDMPVGPLATDGTNYFANFNFDTVGDLALQEVDPQGTNIASLNTGAYTPAIAGGGRYESASQTFVFLALNNGNPTFFAWITPNTLLGQPLNIPSQSDAALAFFNGAYYASVHDATTCALYSATFTPPNIFAFQPIGGWACTTVRFAENNPGVDLYATREQLGDAGPYQLLVRATPGGAPSVVSAVDDQAIVALPAGGTAFHLVWSNAGELHVSTLNPALPNISTSSLIAPTAFQGTGIGFDAVADPGTSIYAVAYWAATPNPGIYFTRACK